MSLIENLDSMCIYSSSVSDLEEQKVLLEEAAVDPGFEDQREEIVEWLDALETELKARGR